jgi:hypothetical protein
MTANMLTDLSLDERREGLLAWAKGIYPIEAAVRLLIATGLDRRTGNLMGLCDSWGPTDTSVMVYVDWEAMAEGGTWSGGERRLLDIICSLGNRVPIDLGDAVSGLDRTNLTLVLAALSHANGSHQHKDMSWFHDAIANGGTMVRPDPNEPYLPPVFAWPVSS